MKKAFSLVELSIVILIIGVLVAAVGQGVELLQDSRIAAARSITQSSRVNSLSGIILWLETTSEASFSSAESSDGSPVTSWNDINPQVTSKNNATQTSTDTTTRPTFIETSINNLPAIRFDGVNDSFDINLAALVGSNYTIFVVEKKGNSSANWQYFIGGADGGTNTNLHIGYRAPNAITQAHFANDLAYTQAGAIGSRDFTPFMHTFWFSSTEGKKYWENGGITVSASESSQTGSLISYNGAKIAKMDRGGNFYKGDIGEMIIFNRALSNKDRQAVENYLSKKWAIKIS